MQIKSSWWENNGQSNSWTMVRKRGSAAQIKSDGGAERRPQPSVRWQWRPLIHPVNKLSGRDGVEQGRRKARRWRSLSRQNRPLSGGNDCSCKPPTPLAPACLWGAHVYRCARWRARLPRTEERRRSDKIRQDSSFHRRHSACLSHRFTKKEKKEMHCYVEKSILNVVQGF